MSRTIHEVPDILLNNNTKIVIGVTEYELNKKSGLIEHGNNEDKKEFKRFSSFRRTFRLNRSFKRSKSTGPTQCK